jgi:ABC-type dipeptide/oligopeptide/nickel transport system permease subunit
MELVTTVRIGMTWCLIVTIVGEVITVVCRIAAGGPATVILRPETHVLIRMHHMFWAIPVLIVACVVQGASRWR